MFTRHFLIEKRSGNIIYGNQVFNLFSPQLHSVLTTLTWPLCNRAVIQCCQRRISLSHFFIKQVCQTAPVCALASQHKFISQISVSGQKCVCFLNHAKYRCELLDSCLVWSPEISKGYQNLLIYYKLRSAEITFVHNLPALSSISKLLVGFYWHRILDIENCINEGYYSSISLCQQSEQTTNCAIVLATSICENQNHNAEVDFWQNICLASTFSKLVIFVLLLTKYISNKRMAPNNKWKMLTPGKFFYTSSSSLVKRVLTNFDPLIP